MNEKKPWPGYTNGIQYQIVLRNGNDIQTILGLVTSSFRKLKSQKVVYLNIPIGARPLTDQKRVWPKRACLIVAHVCVALSSY